jgi:hypothetical protein
MTMTIPVIPKLPAGYVVQQADMANLAYACQFLLYKPISRVHQATAGQSLSAGGTIILWDTVDFDPDGMWSTANKDRLTIQTPGFYRVRYMVATGGVSANAYAQCTTGPNNPAGSGNASPYWPSYGYGNGTALLGAAGDIPQYLYPGDYIRVECVPNSSGNSTSTYYEQSYLSLELVSI